MENVPYVPTEKLTMPPVDIKGYEVPAMKKFLMSMIPISPVPFSQPYAWIRLIGYAATSAYLYKKSKTVSMFFAGAAGVSALSSVLGNGIIESVKDIKTR